MNRLARVLFPVEQSLINLAAKWLLFTSGFPRRSVGWQVEYNAACLYGLMYEARKDPRWIELAFKYLEKAIDDPSNELTPDWVLKGDPDLGILRRHTREWAVVEGRYAEGSKPVPGLAQTLPPEARTPRKGSTRK
jgi:hypothetical protein